MRLWVEESGRPVRELDTAAQGLGLTLVPIVARGPEELGHIFTEVASGRAEALLVEPSGLVFVHQRLLIDGAAKQRLPAVYPFREFVVEGGLMAYGVDLRDVYRRSGIYIDKILKGAKTAKALGLTIPPSLLLRADQVIE